MAALNPNQLLTIWEHGMRRHPIDRALLLFALAVPETPAGALADAPLGWKNAALMALHQATFGARLSVWVDCSACGERMEFEMAPADFPPPPEESPDPDPIEVLGHRFFRPTSRHLAQLLEASDAETAARRLLRACAASPDALPQDEETFTALLDAAEEVMDETDPWAALSVTVRCPACDAEDDISLDIASLLWEQIESHAQRLLDDIHLLAQAYGWSESQVLGLSETRRAAYLARVQP